MDEYDDWLIGWRYEEWLMQWPTRRRLCHASSRAPGCPYRRPRRVYC